MRAAIIPELNTTFFTFALCENPPVHSKETLNYYAICFRGNKNDIQRTISFDILLTMFMLASLPATLVIAFPGLLPTRYITCVMLGLACVVMAILRSNMSIIILAMTKNPYDPTEELPDYGVRYQWSTYEQSLVIGSYFWGNTVICSIAGVYADRYGARNILVLAFTIAAILSSLSAIGAQYLWSAILIRFLTGIAMGTVFPSIHALAAKWAPPEEKGKFLSVMNFTGIGVIIDWSMSGHIIEEYGWKYAFYVVAIIFGIFILLLLTFVYDSPSKHPRISEEEKEYIFSKLNATVSNKKPWAPFRSILTSVPFWALLIFNFGDLCGFYMLLTSVARYLSEVHSFTITATGLYASIPYLTIAPVGIIFGLINDFLLKRNLMSPNAIRKWFSLFSHFLPGCFLACITFVGDRPYVCLAFITIALALNASVVITKLNNAHDLSPNFAPTIYGLMSLVGTSAGYIMPMLVAYFTRERSTVEEWQKIFFVGAGLFIGSNVIFLLFGSGHIQKWNEIQKEGTTDDDLNGTDMTVVTKSEEIK